MCAYLLDSKLSLSAKQHSAALGNKPSINAEWGVARALMLKVGILMVPISISLFSLIYSMTLVSAAKIATDGAIKETVLLMKEASKPLSNSLNSFNQQNLLLGHLDHLIENESFGNKEKHLLLSETHQAIEIPSWYPSALNNIDIVTGEKYEWLNDVPLSVTPSAVDEALHIGGHDYIAIGMIIPSLRWRYFRLIPKEQLTAPLIRIFNFMLLGFLLIAMIAGVIYDRIFQNYVISRLNLLTKAAKALATGDPNARVGNLGHDEIGEAAIAFDQMASSFECHRNIESLLNRLEHDYLDGKKSKVLLDDACRHLANISGFPLVWVALQREDRLQISGVGGALALDFKSYESSALSFCAEAIKSRGKSYLHSGEAAYPGGPSGQAAVFPLSLGTDVIGAIVFHASAKSSFVADQWNAMHYWSDRLQHTLHVMENEREMLDVRLRMLQAQIEPHFLVNTLSNIITQVKAKPAVAKHMLTLLASYLRVSLTRTRGERTTLKQELEILSVYLEIQAFRMPGRLTHSIKCAEELQVLRFPPLLLQPLVENAVQHGIEPAVNGGNIDIQIYTAGEKLILSVSDTGIGLVNRNRKKLPHRGVGISNIRNRLSGLYGQSANLKITQNEPCGVLAMMEIPLNALESI